MATMAAELPYTLNERRRSSTASTSSASGSGGFRKAFGAVARRVSLPRRDSQDKKHSPTLPIITDVTNTHPSVESSAASTRSSFVSSYKAPLMLLNSSSPASEIPQTWAEWNKAYQMGLIDYNDPPPPPSNLWSASENASPTGQYRAPTPLEETARQRAVDNLDLLNHKPYQRRSSLGVSPKTSSRNTEFIPEEDESELELEENGEEKDDMAPRRTVVQGNAGLVAPYPKELATHPALLKLAQDAKTRFGTGGGTVSLMDEGSQVFLAEEGFNAQELPRQSTICSHTMLKAAATNSKDPLVVLDIANDWRFAENDFGQFNKGFYAAAPIMLPSALGDSEERRPAGIFCVIDSKPRKEFTKSDREELEKMADQAAEEILRAAREKAAVKGANLRVKREAWKRSKLVRRVSEKTSLDSVEELETPPTSPAAEQMNESFKTVSIHSASGLSIAEDEHLDQLTAQAIADHELTATSSDGTSSLLASKRPSLAESASDAGSVELAVTDITPTFGRRRGRKGVHAPSQRIPEEIKSVLDLSCQLMGESLSIDFTYILAIDLPTSSAASPRTAGEKPLRLLASHNVPIPAPLFDVDFHLATLTSHRHALLYTDPDFSGAEGEFSSGLLIKILTTDNVGYVLGAFTEDPRRVLNKQDYHFMSSFATDLARQVAKI